MTERKPPGVTFESWVDKQIREAAERGEFDNLPGAGKPLPNAHQQYDELWWVRDKARREGLPTDVLLPTSLRLRKEIEQLRETLRDLRSEQVARAVVRDLNERIVAWLRSPSGPRVPVAPVNVETAVRQWREDQSAPTGPPAGDAVVDQQPRGQAPPEPRRWWRRFTRRA
ncbi:DnaJ family domain-containing protein [Streptoalloteichus hindustanus]|uniref:DnaJ homologue subfamily C member 28 conserved domain-containing protein n=1 Tax=Streptoalloteichus hindustanus TaxID=2017 RepID=A0A1M5CY64_STRHI|nr:DUF1992 domain-containing protein [Streptoalloteichus hindustanus]SHF59656.1 protein of unknown function [Streptoalloteichus hindustanus]